MKSTTVSLVNIMFIRIHVALNIIHAVLIVEERSIVAALPSQDKNVRLQFIISNDDPEYDLRVKITSVQDPSKFIFVLCSRGSSIRYSTLYNADNTILNCFYFKHPTDAEASSTSNIFEVSIRRGNSQFDRPLKRKRHVDDLQSYGKVYVPTFDSNRQLIRPSSSVGDAVLETINTSGKGDLSVGPLPDGIPSSRRRFEPVANDVECKATLIIQMI